FTRDPIFGPMLIADHDFLIHDNKNNVTQFYTDFIDVEICRTNTTWELPLSEEMIIRNQISACDRMASYDRYIAGVYSMSIGVDVDCILGHQFQKRKFIDDHIGL
ncbi:unnamed protein product, partial [Rotaria sp. Silwood2]